MSWINLHSHSSFCDGKADPEEFILAAIEKKFLGYGYSSHAPTAYDTRWNMKKSRVHEYIQEIEHIRSSFADKIEVYAGLELDYSEHIKHPEVARQSFDYIIGSVHFLGEYPDGSGFCFDGDPEQFFKGVETIFNNDFRRVITRYYELSVAMIENTRPDIIGHMDKIKMHEPCHHYVDESESWYVGLVHMLLDAVKRQNCIVEINTRGTYRKKPPMLYPGDWVIRIIRDKKIPVMINSDAHHPSEIDLGFRETAKLLLESGIKTIRTLYKGRWTDMPFSENGLII